MTAREQTPAERAFSAHARHCEWWRINRACPQCRELGEAAEDAAAREEGTRSDSAATVADGTEHGPAPRATQAKARER